MTYPSWVPNATTQSLLMPTRVSPRHYGMLCCTKVSNRERLTVTPSVSPCGNVVPSP